MKSWLTKLKFTAFAIFCGVFLSMFAVMCTLAKNDPSSDPAYIQTHANLRFCVSAQESQGVPQFDLLFASAYYGAKELVFVKRGDAYCASFNRVLESTLIMQCGIILRPVNNEAKRVNRLEAIFPDFNEQGVLVLCIPAHQKKNNQFRMWNAAPYEDDVVISPRTIPDDKTNDFL